jgi:hypothetical protein
LKVLAIVALVGFLSACSAVGGKLLEVAGNDLQRTSELAAKYGKPEVKQCADFLVASVGKLNAEEGNLQALLAEDTSGLFSAALKAVLVKEYLASLNDPARADAFRKEFDLNCKAVAGQIVLNIVRDAAKVGSRTR